MSRSGNGVSMLFLPLFVAGLCLFCALEWSASRSLNERQAAQLSSFFRDCERRAGNESQQTRAFLRSVKDDLSELSRQVARLGSAAPAGADLAAPSAPSPDEATPEAAPAEEETLPPLPEDLNAEVTLKNLDVETFFKDPAYNPQGIEPSRLKLMSALREVTTARARMEIIESEVQLGVVKAVDALRESGQYVEYREGDVPEAVPGVLTAAEPTEDNGFRMYYLEPEQFPDIYEARRLSKEVAEIAFRRLLSMAGAANG